MNNCDGAIIGGGPYGLSAAAHLSHVRGLDIKLFGEPMSFRERHMPQEMLLRSPWAGSHIAAPRNQLTLNAYRELKSKPDLQYPIPLRDFIDYGHWFHAEIGTPADRRKVSRTDVATNGYRLTLEDGDVFHARRVVIAGGIQPFVYRPRVFENLPPSLVMHTSELRDYSQFRGKEVLVIGGGQS